MTLTTTTVRADLPGTGTTGPFAYPFRIFEATDLVVLVRDAAGTETVLSYPADYTVSGVGNTSGGSVTTTAAVASGATLTILRATPVTQTTDIKNQGAFFPRTHEDAFDRMVAGTQQVQEQGNRALRLAKTFDPTDFTTELNPTVAGQVPTWTADGFTMTALDTSADVALPGEGRTVTTLTGYLHNNRVYNIRDFGAVNGGNSTDAIDLVVAAITAAGAGRMYVPMGQYQYLGTFTPPDHIEIFGDGNAISLIQFPTTGAAANRRCLLNGTHQYVHDVGFEETGVPAAPSGRGGVYGVVHLDAATYTTCVRVGARNGSGIGMMATRRSQYFLWEECQVTGNAADALHVQRGSCDGRLVRNHAVNNGDDTIGLISHGYTESDGASGTWGRVARIHLSNNRLGAPNATYNLGSGIVFGGAQDCTSDQDKVYNPREAGISIVNFNGGAEGHAMVGNISVSKPRIYGAGQNAAASIKDAIYVANARNVSIDGPEVYGAAGNGVSLVGCLINVSVRGGRFFNIAGGRFVYVAPTVQTGAEYLLLWTDAAWSTGESKAYVFGHRIIVEDNEGDTCQLEGFYYAGNASNSIEGLVARNNRAANINKSDGAGTNIGHYYTYASPLRAQGNGIATPFPGTRAVSSFQYGTGCIPEVCPVDTVGVYLPYGDVSTAVGPTHAPTVRFTAALTADRTLALAAGAPNCILSVIRDTTSTGAFNLLVGPGIATLATGQGVDIEWNTLLSSWQVKRKWTM